MNKKLLTVVNALPVFEEAALMGNFAKAGEALGIPQPSVSRYIANLERHLGVKLFKRAGRQNKLTQEGEILLKATTAGLEQIRDVFDYFLPEGRARVLVIECTYGFAHMWLYPRIQGLMKHLPDWTIRLSSLENSTPDMRHRNVISIRIGSGNWPDGEGVLLFDEEVFPVCSPKFYQEQFTGSEGISPEQIARTKIIYQDLGENAWMGWDEWFKTHGVQFKYPRDAQPVFHYPLALQSAMEGRGIALAWNHLAEPYLKNGWLTEIPNLRTKTNNGYYLVAACDSLLKKQITQWIEAL